MRADIPVEWVQRLAALGAAEQADFVARMDPGDLLHWDAMFECWSANGQIAPSGAGWRVWLLMAGRGFGKTRAGAEWIHTLAGSGTRRIALVGATIDDARRVMVEGPSGLLAVARRRRVKVKWEPSLGRLTWPQGSQAQLFSGDSPDGLRGPAHDFAWCDELAKWRKPDETWMNLDFGLRGGTRARALVTTTPRPMALLDRLRADPETVETGGRTGDNASLPERFVAAMVRTYGNSRIGRQEIDGELMSEAEGSLFPRALIERARCAAAADYDRVVVAIDPPASERGDKCGIVVAGRAGKFVDVLADASLPACGPDRWARVAVAAAEQWGASHIVAEANQGGAMVKSVLATAGAEVRVRLVYASSGKVARAEPVAMAMETGRARLAGVFPELEAELAGLQIGGRYDGPSRSPDRADAMVWAVSELMDARSGVPRVRAL
ncbi:terminase large subunit domain-containing protein [Sphingomonas mesophila]|uniref:terminase large subunit domain-containing protein n=1 Tax=Sphingomonas mesophila TaxID=2303576 RepID=UPI001F07A10C|nr:terminase family protein [Sphingomonas mesophila]